MSKANWLLTQLESTGREVDSWDDWKRDAMRREVALFYDELGLFAGRDDDTAPHAKERNADSGEEPLLKTG
jgi:hypothetical protein